MKILLNTTLLTALVLAGCSSSDTVNDTVGDEELVNDSGGTSDSGGEQANDSARIIRDDNHEQLLKEVISVLNLRAINDYRMAAGSYDDVIHNDEANVILNGNESSVEGLILESITTTPESREKMVYACSGEGTLTSFFRDAGGSGQLDRNLIFDGCLATDTWRDGQYQARSDGSRSDSVEIFTNFSTRQDDAERSLSGEWTNESFVLGTWQEQFWRDATFASTGTTEDMMLSAFDWHRMGGVSPFFDDLLTGYVQDLEGNSRYVEELRYLAQLDASFQFSNATTGNSPVQVSVSLNLSGDFFSWDGDDYPVSDLGTPLILSSSDSLDDDVQSVDNLPRDIDAQWLGGELTITAEDGSVVSLRPSTEDKTLLEIELNASGDIQARSWSEGFVIDCPSSIAGCGDAAAEF